MFAYEYKLIDRFDWTFNIYDGYDRNIDQIEILTCLQACQSRNAVK